MKKLLLTYNVFLTVALTVFLLVSFSRKQNPPVTGEAPEIGETENMHPVVTRSSLSQVITSIDLGKPYDFAGEAVPKDNFDAMERLERELLVNSYWHSSTLLNIKTTQRFFPVIEPILQREGIPDDFKYLAVAESNLRNATSPAGARGIWQFLKATGTHYGLEINSEVDERNHIERATEAACRYLKDYYKQFGSWTLAAAAYNMGGPRLKSRLAEQKAGTYYDLNLNEETSRYVFRILAIKEILQEPRTFGYFVEENDLYQPLDYKTIAVNTSIASLGEFAQQHGTTYRMLKVYNPWLLDNSLTVRGGKTYEIKIPR